MSEVLASTILAGPAQAPEQPAPTETLKQHYKKAVKKFLKTVVVVDDKAYKSQSVEVSALVEPSSTDPLDELTQESPSSSPETLTLPAAAFTEVLQEVEALAEENVDPVLEPEAHELDGPGLVRLFAGHGIVCSIIQPDEDTEITRLVDEIKNIAQAADVLVLDWELKPGDFTASLSTIEALIKKDTESGGRLRFIVIYTASGQRAVKKEIRRVFPQQKTAGHLIYINSACVVVLNKPSITHTNGVPLADLPEKIFDLHSELSAGLLPAAALSAIGTIRNHTHQVLSQFQHGLDAAFIAHRALIPRPDDAELHLIELVSDSLQHLMLTEGVRDQISDELCIARLKSLPTADSLGNEVISAISGCISSYSTSKLSLIKEALGLGEGESQPQRRFIERLYTTPAEADNARKNMAFLHDFTRTHIQKTSASHPPRLTLGTVVAKPREQTCDFYLCIQPRCDSVRFENVRHFPFMKLDNDTISPNIHLQWGGAFRTLAVTEKLYDLVSFAFGSIQESTQAVLAEFSPENSKWFFETPNGEKLYWVGDLRKDKAQRLASKIASRLHLPGINEYEPTRQD